MPPLPNDQALVGQIAANAMGVQPPAPPAAPAMPAAAPPQPPAEPKTPQEKAATALPPGDEGTRSNEEPLSYIKVKINGQERQLSPDQIASTFDRYSNLNYRHAQLAPVVQFAEKLMQATAQSGQPVQPGQLAQFLEAATRAYVSNPQMGQQTPPTPGTGNPARPNVPVGPHNSNIDAELSKWEEENGVKLPPMYRQGLQQINTMAQRNQALEGMLRQVLQQAQGVGQQANAMVQDANQTRTEAIRRTIAHNLNQAQARFQLPDEAEQDFFTFAFERGYTVEDFADPNLTMKVVSDFSAARNTPEMDRLRQIAQRRQSYTGVTSSGPGAAGAGTPTQSFDQQFIGAVTDQVFKRRNG